MRFEAIMLSPRRNLSSTLSYIEVAGKRVCSGIGVARRARHSLIMMTEVGNHIITLITKISYLLNQWEVVEATVKAPDCYFCRDFREPKRSSDGKLWRWIQPCVIRARAWKPHNHIATTSRSGLSTGDGPVDRRSITKGTCKSIAASLIW